MKYINPSELASHYSIIRPLDRDGHVFLVRAKDSGSYLVKRILEGEDLYVYNTLSELAVPGIPRPLFFSESNNKFIILEEYIEGQTLQDIIREVGPLDKNLVFNYLVQLCDILAPLHKHTPAIIHRDIKPSNILVSNLGQIYLLDFDAATCYSPTKDRDTVLLGTQGYAAPEQYGFNASNPRTDIYALGRLGIELSTGCTNEANSYSGPYKLILNRCTSMDPKNRYGDATELRRELLRNKNNSGGLKLPGYRSGKKLPMVIASILYAFLPFFSIVNLIGGNITQFLWGIVFSLTAVVLAMVVFNYRDYLARLPGTHANSPGIRIACRCFYTSILLFILLLILGTLISLE